MAFSNNLRTDEQRSNVFLNNLPKADQIACYGDICGLKFQEYFNREATKEEKEILKYATNIFSGMRPFFLRKQNGETPISYDLRRGQLESIIAYVNAGADDFNSAALPCSDPITNNDRKDLALFIANDQNAIQRLCADGYVLCPSFMLAAQFQNPNADVKSGVNQFELKKRIETTNDILYIFSQLKKRGLNEAAFNGRLDAFSRSPRKRDQEMAVYIYDSFRQMNDLLEIPETERFNSLIVPARILKNGRDSR